MSYSDNEIRLKKILEETFETNDIHEPIVGICSRRPVTDIIKPMFLEQSNCVVSESGFHSGESARFGPIVAVFIYH